MEALGSTWISSTGPYLDRFERDFAQRLSIAHCATSSNGTTALHLALLGLGIGPGDEVVVPDLCYVAPGNAILYCGAEPVLCDVDEADWTLDPQALKEVISPRTNAVVAVHNFGNLGQIEDVLDVCRSRGIWLIEDAAEAHFASLGHAYAGTIGDVGTFSFFGNTVLTSGEGGAVVTDDQELDARVRFLKGQGMDPHRRYFFPEVGYNYRLTNVAAAILCAQLSRADSLLAERQKVFDVYDEVLEGHPQVRTQRVRAGSTRTPWLYSVVLLDADRDAVMGRLAQLGIESRPFFYALSGLPAFARCRTGELHVSSRLSASGISLPTFPELEVDEVRWIAEALVAALHGSREAR